MTNDFSRFLYIIPLIGYFMYMMFGAGCGGSLPPPDEERLASDPRFSGKYISTLEGDECSPNPDAICETEIMVTYSAEREEEGGDVTYHSGLVTLYAKVTGDTPYQNWTILLLDGAVQNRGRVTGDLRVHSLNIENEIVVDHYPATVTLEPESDLCPELIRIVTDGGGYELTAERTTLCRDEG